MDSVSNRFSRYLDAKKIRQSEIAEIFGVKRQTIGAIVNGRSKLTLEQAILLLKFDSDLNYKWLLFGEGEMIKSKYNNEEIKTANETDQSYAGNNPACIEQIKSLRRELKSKDIIIASKEELLEMYRQKGGCDVQHKAG